MKGQIYSQFVWLFALIAGISFLVFFVLLSKGLLNERVSADKAKVVSAVERYFFESRSSHESLDTLLLPLNNVVLSCDEYRGIFVKVDEYEKPLRNGIVYSSGKLGYKTFVFSEDFKKPFLVDVVSYAVSPEIYFVFSPEVASFNLFSNNFTIFVNDSPEFIEGNSYVFVTSKDDFLSLKPPRRSKVVVLKVSSPSGFLDVDGLLKIDFYDWRNKWVLRGSSFSFDRISFLGAVVSGDVDVYDCVTSRLLSRLRILSSLYLSKTEKIINELNSSPCAPLYSNVVNALQSLKTAEFKPDSLRMIDEQALILERTHKDVTESRGCPYVY